MNKILTILFILLAWTAQTVQAQITISATTLPAVGDTLRTAIDNLPTNIDVGTPGASKMWFFNTLEAPFVIETPIRPANEGSAANRFPTASFFTSDVQFGGLENYYRVDNGRLFNLGFSGNLPIGVDVDAVGRYAAPGLLERTTPLRYQDVFNDEKILSIPFSASIIPDTFFAGLPIRPDSIRLRVTTQNQSTVDAWGTVMIPSGSFDVLRVRTRNINNRALEVKANPIPAWFPFPIELPGITGIDTSIIYTFLSDKAKEPIAVVTTDANGQNVLSVEYKADSQVITSAYNKDVKNADMFAYPNPAIGSVRFDLVGLEPGRYTIRIYNILGIEVWSKSYQVNTPSRTVRLDLDGFNKGTYLYSLSNDKGRTMLTKRLIVLRP